jgi:hypothetical protein
MKLPGFRAVPLLFATLLFVSVAGAAAASSWQAGTGFQVGGVYFHVVSTGPDSEALFRVTERLDSSGLEEHPDCYRVSRTFYHRESCPVVQAHFRRYGSDAASAAPRIAVASTSGGSHPINYLQGNYEPPRPDSYYSWIGGGFWYNPWFAHGGFRPGRPPYRPGFGPGFRPGRPGVRPPHGGGFGFRVW